MKIIKICLILPAFFFSACAHSQTQNAVANFFDQSIEFNKIENYSISNDGTFAIVYDGYRLNGDPLAPNEYASYLCLDFLAKNKEVEKHKVKLFNVSLVFRNEIQCYVNGNEIVAVSSYSLKDPDIGIYNISEDKTVHKILPNTKLNPGFMGCFDQDNRFYLIDQTNDSLRCRIYDNEFKILSRFNIPKNTNLLKNIYWDNSNDYYLTYTFHNVIFHNKHLIIIYGMEKVPHTDNTPDRGKRNTTELAGVEIIDLENQTVSDLQYWELADISVKKTLQIDYPKVKIIAADKPGLSLKIFIGGLSEDIPGIFEIHLDNRYQPVKYLKMQTGKLATVSETAPLPISRILDLLYDKNQKELFLLIFDRNRTEMSQSLMGLRVQ